LKQKQEEEKKKNKRKRNIRQKTKNNKILPTAKNRTGKLAP
jgi:hypothetical protein